MKDINIIEVWSLPRASAYDSYVNYDVINAYSTTKVCCSLQRTCVFNLQKLRG